jgi:hypothetical protein
VDQAQARAILYLKAEIVRARSFGSPHLYKFWEFVVDETTSQVWKDGEATTTQVWLTTDYGLQDGSGYRDRRRFRIDKDGRVSLVQASAYDGSVIEGGKSGRLAVGVYRSVMWPSSGK